MSRHDLPRRERAPRCRIEVTLRGQGTRQCLSRTWNPNGCCARHQLEARLEATR